MEERPVERAVEAVFLLHALMTLVRRDDRQAAPRDRGRCAGRRRRRSRSRLRVADHLLECPRAQEREVLADLFGDELKEVLDELGLAR